MRPSRKCIATLDLVTPLLPENKPRYLMGVGTPEDLINGIARGIDIFDCVLPTRLARHNAVFSSERASQPDECHFCQDARPIDETCTCYTCRTFTRAYLRHLIVAKELLAGTLLSIHNLHALIQLVNDIRESIQNNTFESNASVLVDTMAGQC